MFIIGLWIWIFIFVGIPILLSIGFFGVMLFGMYKKMAKKNATIKGHPKEKIMYNEDGTYDNTFVSA